METRQVLALVDEDTNRRASICSSLSDRSLHFEPYESVQEFERCALHNHIVLLHDRGADISDLQSWMVEHSTWSPVIAFDESPDPHRIVDAIFDGAIDYLTWPFTRPNLCETIIRVQNRAFNLNDSTIRTSKARALISQLTNRERQVLSLVADGMPNRIIGSSLEISPRTVEIHRANMLNKLGAKSTVDAVRLAFDAKLDD